MVLAYSSYGYGYGYDPTWLLLVITGVIAIIAQIRVSSSFSKYSKVESRTGLTGAEAAERILHSKGIYDVRIQHIAGSLTDNYNPADKTLNLSDATYNSRSVAAIGVAAHECGHAIQHDEGYSFLNFRTMLFPIAHIGSQFSFVLILLGLVFGSFSVLIDIGIILFSAAVLFQLVTLPVEFNASSRALRLLADNGILYDGEVEQTKKVLSAAAMTYVASAATAIIQLARLLMLRGRSRD